VKQECKGSDIMDEIYQEINEKLLAASL